MKKLLSYLLLLPIYFYQKCISPLTSPSCRFTPTCSQYAVEAIKKHGPFKGLYLAIRRILRCHANQEHMSPFLQWENVMKSNLG